MTAAGTIARTRQIQASLEFRDVAGRTHLMGQYTPHPFHITRPFRHCLDPQGMATLYLQSSSGGLYGDDDLELTIRVGEGAAAHVTTQASSIVHDARGRDGALQEVRLEVEAGGWLEYMPDPAILMTGARLTNRVSARFGQGARLLVADAQLCHDPAGDGAPFDQLENMVSFTGPQGPLMLDRFTLDGTDWMRRTGGARCAGMIATVGADEAGPAMLSALDALPGLYAGLSVFPERGLTLLRFLADDGVALSRALTQAWNAARIALTGIRPQPRRK